MKKFDTNPCCPFCDEEPDTRMSLCYMCDRPVCSGCERESIEDDSIEILCPVCYESRGYES